MRRHYLHRDGRVTTDTDICVIEGGQADLFPTAPAPRPPGAPTHFADEVQSITGCTMSRRDNAEELAKWLKRLSEEEIISRLTLFCYFFRGRRHPNGGRYQPGTPNLLSGWRWQVFTDPMVLAERAGCL
jgi:hypothetical protein